MHALTALPATLHDPQRLRDLREMLDVQDSGRTRDAQDAQNGRIAADAHRGPGLPGIHLGAGTPLLSVVMPVFNSGAYLLQAVASVLRQDAIDGLPLPATELLIVDDGSTEPLTLAVLEEAVRLDPRVRLLRNQRSKGAAGARNTGIAHARGEWIGFIDSDDVWMPHALALRWQTIQADARVRWVAGRFRLLKTDLSPDDYQRDSARFSAARTAGTPPPPARRMARPFLAFTKACLIQTTTVLIRRDLIVEMALFNERLRRAEDYHLWCSCAVDHDLWLIDEEISYYRIHEASLTHGDAPRYLKEDLMIELLLQDDRLDALQRRGLLWRLDFVMQDECFFFRHRRQFDQALRTAARWVVRRPLRVGGWKELLASALRRS